MRFLICFMVGSAYVIFIYTIWRLLDILTEDITEDETGIKDKLPPCYGKTEVQSCFKSRDECFECMMNCLDSIEEYVDENTKGR